MTELDRRRINASFILVALMIAILGLQNLMLHNELKHEKEITYGQLERR
jgi:hypothetical protein